MKDRSDSLHPATMILCDFDGTLSPHDMGHDVLNRFTDASAWERINNAYETERIGSREAYRLLALHLKANRDDMLRYVLHSGRLDGHFPSFYDFCRSRGYRISVVSDGLDLYIEALLSKYGFPEIKYYANRVVFHDDGAVTFEFPHENHACGRCGNCKRSILQAMRRDFGTIIYIGDGYSDLCPARDADLVFARDILYREYRSRGRRCFYYRDFSDIHQYLENACVRGMAQKSAVPEDRDSLDRMTPGD